MTTNKTHNALSTTRRVLTATAFLVVFCFGVSSSYAASFSQRNEENLEEAPAYESTDEADDRQHVRKLEPWFRFWKAPEESMSRWPWGSETYYPISVKSFNEWLQIFEENKRESLGETNVLPWVGVPSLRLEAFFDGSCLEGRGVFTTSNAATKGDSETLPPPFRSRDFSLAFSFSSNEEVNPDERLGFYPDKRFYWPATDKKDRAFRWSRRAEINARGDAIFDLAFPSSFYTELVLDAPQEYLVETSEGLVRETSLPQSEEPRGVKRWKAFFGARSYARIRVFRATPLLASSESQTISYRRDATFNVSLEGLEVVSQFDFDAGSSFEIKPELFFPKPLVPASFEWNGIDASRFVVERTDMTSGTSFKFSLPSFEEDSTRNSLKIVAICPLNPDFDGTLPDVLLESDAFFWRETVCRVRIEPPLAASSITPKDAVQTVDATLSRQSGRDSFLFKYIKANGEIALRLRSLKRVSKFDSATDCLVLPTEAIAKTTLLVDVDATTSRQIEIPIAQNWEIESVLTSAEEPIVWNIQEKTTKESSDTRVLLASFKNPPTPKQPTRLTISGRLPCSFDKSVEVDRLCPVDVSENLYGAHALSLRSESQSQVKITSRFGRPFVARNVSPNFVFGESQLREVLSSTPSSTRLYLGEQTVDAVATLENLRSNYSVGASCYVRLLGNRFEEKWNLRFTPSPGARIDSVVFFASESTSENDRSNNWFWSNPSEPNKTYEVERLNSSEVVANIPNGVVPYEIKLATSRTVPFELNVCYSADVSDVVQVPLLFFDEETEKKTSEIVVDSPTSVPFWTNSNLLTETSAPSVPQGQYESLKRAYRYETSISGRRLSGVPKLEISFSSFSDPSKPTEVLASSLWCWFENYDSFYESNGSSRERVTYFIENRGSSCFNVTLPPELGFDSLRSVWLEGKQISVSKAGDGKNDDVLKIELPSDRRFVCVTFECYAKNARKYNDFRRKPYRIECDAPVLSGEWNAWASSQYQPLSARTPGAASYWFRLRDRVFLRYFRTKKSTEAASRLASRLGSFETLRGIVESTRSTESLNVKDALTLGDVFGSEQVVDALCTSGTIKDATETFEENDVAFKESSKSSEPDVNSSKDENDRTTSKKNESQEFESTQTPRKPFRFCIDLVALARIGATPRTPLPLVAANDPMERAEKLLDSAGLAVLFLSSDFAVLTTIETALRYDLPNAPLRDCSNVRLIKNEYDSIDAQTRVLNLLGRRYVEPSLWLKSDELISPWHETLLGENTPGWEHVSLPLDKADEGAFFVHRHFLSGLGFFSFIAYVALTWNFRTFSFRFFLGTAGVCLALLSLLPLVVSVAVEGVVLGACSLFILSCLQHGSDSSNEPSKNVRKQGETSIGQGDETSDCETSYGFVDLKRLSPEEYALVQGSQATAPYSARSGRTALRTLGCLVLICVMIVASGASNRRTDDENASTSVSTSQKKEFQAPQGVDLNADITTYPRSSHSIEETLPQRGVWEAPYCVFVPINKERVVSGDYYWVESSFYDVIRSALNSRPREKNWRVVDARYEGGVEYNGEGIFSLYNLKITYQICLDASNAVVSLPAVQLAPDVGSRFDKQAIAPSYDEQRDELSFEIIDSTPGVHTLELTVTLPTFSENGEQISIPILPCSSARVELDVPNDAPALDIPNALGKTTRGFNRLIAELGPVDRLVVKKGYAPSLDVASTFNAEQYALMRLKPTQTDLRASFRCQASVGKIQRLEIECDPSFSFSGYCKCDVAEITSLEPPSVQDPTLRVSFDKPVSGSFTLNADFVARDFSGIGQIQIPRFLCRGAHITRNWLALIPCSDALCSHTPDSNVSISSFKSAWGSFDETPFAVCDLAKTPKDAFVSTRVASGALDLSETKTYVFRPSYVETRVQARFDAKADTFRLTLGVPKTFVVDSIRLFDDKENALEKPETVATDEELTLIFNTPLKGAYSLEIIGRSKTRVDRKAVLPDVKFQGSLSIKSFVRIYCDENVYLEFEPPHSWTPMDQASYAELGEEPNGSLYHVGVYEIDLSRKQDDSQAVLDDVSSDAQTSLQDEASAASASLEPSGNAVQNDEANVSDGGSYESAQFTARVNAPQITGVGRIVTYHKYTEDWKATVEFKLSIQNGRVERFFVLMDDAFSIDSPDQNADFNLSETTAPSGLRAVMFEPKRRLKDEVVLKFDATFKKGREGLRLPRYVLLPGSEREDVSGIKTYVMLPKRDKSLELSWSTQNMRELTQGSDEWKTAASFSPPSVNPSTAALAKNGNVSSNLNVEETDATSQNAATKPTERNVASDSGVMRRVNDDVGMSVDEFYVYERNEGASASFETEQDRFRVTQARYMFFMNGRREYFGAVSFLIPPNGREDCVVIVPKECKILEANVNGSRRLVERLDERRWKVDLDSTKYAKFLEISFQGDGKTNANDKATFGSKKADVFDVRFVCIENVKPEQTIWACAFENVENVGDRWQVFQRDFGKTRDLAPTKGELALCVKEPISYSDASELLFKLAISHGAELLDAFERDATLVSETRDDDFDRLRSRWATLWLRFGEELERFPYLERPQNELTEDQRNAVLCVEKGNVADALNPEASPWVSWNYSKLLEILAQKDKLAEIGRFDLKSINVDEFDSTLPRRLWTLDVGSDARLLVGATDEKPERIIFAATRRAYRFYFSSYATCVFILATTAILLNLLRKESTSRRFHSVFFGVLIVLWTLLFFLFDSKLLGLVGAVLLAVGPPIFSSIRRRLSRRRNERLAKNQREVSELIDPEATTALEEGTSTEMLDFASDTECVAVSDGNLNPRIRDDSDPSYNSQFFD